LFCSDDYRSWPREEKFWSDDCRSWPREEKINNHGCWGKHVHIHNNDYWGNVQHGWNRDTRVIVPLYTCNCTVYIYYSYCVNIYFSFICGYPQFWVKKTFPWTFNLEYSGTFTKIFMHVSSRNMFPTTRNLQIRVHVYQPRQPPYSKLNFQVKMFFTKTGVILL
jgi:hypothetical protein